MDKTPQFRTEMRKSWELVEDKFQGAELLGKKAFEILSLHAARASHHQFPYSMNVLAQLVSCTNGATTEVFPGTQSPLMMTNFNNNYPQTRKSCGFATGRCITKAVDTVVLDIAETRVKDTFDAAHSQPGASAQVPRVTVNSSTLTSFTEAAFFQRCAGDWDQVVPSEKHTLSGRVYFGTLVNLDEAYKYFKMIGLVPAQSSGKPSDASSGVVADGASEVNKLLQTGSSTLTTKTAGTFGQGNAPGVSMGLTGNSHPAITIPMLRGEYGGDVVAVAYRHLFSSGPPIEPHQALPQNLPLPADFKKWLWPQLLPCMLSPLGLPAWSCDMAAAVEQLSHMGGARVDDTADDSNDEESGDHEFKPSSNGFSVTLADGTVTRLRFRRDSRDTWLPELRTANRDIPIPEEEDLERLAQRVLQYFKTPHKSLPWSEPARLTFKGFQACFDTQCATLRDRGSVGEAARFGVSPWLLGMLAAALVVLEIAADEGADGGERCVQVNHVIRAYDLLQLYQEIVQIWAGQESTLEAASIEEARVGVELANRRAAAARLPGLERSGFSDFLATQFPPTLQDPNVLMADGSGTAQVRQSQQEQSQVMVGTPSTRYLLAGDTEVPNMDVGYGESGASVQMSDVSPILLKDREIMKRTVLRGTATVFGNDVCENVRVRLPETTSSGQPPAKKTRSTLKMCHWIAVVQAGLGQYRVGELDLARSNADRKGPRVHFQMPPEGDKEAECEFHNRLMKLCGVGYRSFCEAVQNKNLRTKKHGQEVAVPQAQRTTNPSNSEHLGPVGLAPADVANGPGE